MVENRQEPKIYGGIDMKALRVICIIFMILGIIFTGVCALLSSGVNMELDSIKELKEGDKKTKIGTEVTWENGEPSFKLSSSDEIYTEEKYKEMMDQVHTASNVGMAVCGGVSVLCLAGIIVTTVKIKKRND